MNFPAQKVEIIGLKEKCKEILNEMQLEGVAEIISLNSDQSNRLPASFEEGKSKVELKLAEMKFAKSFLSEFKEKEGFISGLLESFFPQKEKYFLEEIVNLVNEGSIDELVQECQDLEKGLNKIDSQKEKLTREIQELEKFSGIDSISAQEFNNFNLFVGSINKDKKDQLLLALKEKSIFFFIKWCGEENSKMAGFYMVYPKNEPELVEILKSEGAKEETFSWKRPPAELLVEKKNEIEVLEKKRLDKIKRAEELTQEIPKVEALIDWYGWELEKYNTFEKGESTEKYFYLKAWVSGNKIDYLREKIKKQTDYSIVNPIEPEEGEIPPVEIQNKDMTENFETVTGVYGVPRADEPDPTPYLAPFFAVAFGLALSDAGYGILLIAMSYLMAKKLKDSKNFFNLFVIAGIFTVIAGLFTGTFFGTDIFAGFRFVDAVSDPIEVLYLVSVFGLIQIFIGLVIGMFWNLKKKNINVALGEKLGSIVFFLGIAVFALLRQFEVLIIFTGAMMLLNIIFSEEKKIAKRILSGFGALYGLIGYFSDVLSYSRLLALGLATGIIAMTINMIAGIFMEMIPVTGLNVVVAGAILIFGHVANLLINALSSFIHAARLQFVEFFSKFMEGGGRKFKPFSKKGQFVEIIKK